MTIKGDYHLMIDEPSRLYESFDLKKVIEFVFMLNVQKNLHKDIMRLKDLGISPGVALSPATPLAMLD